MTHGEADTGMFAAGNTLVGLANLFVIGLCNFLTPKSAQAFAREGSEGLSRVLRKATIVFIASLGLFCLIAAFFGNYLALIVYGEKYHGAGPIIAVLSVATLLDALGLTANNGLWAIDRPAANFPADIAQLIVTLGTALWFVFPVGTAGNRDCVGPRPNRWGFAPLDHSVGIDRKRFPLPGGSRLIGV